MSKRMDRRGFLKALPFIPAATIDEIKEPTDIGEGLIIRPPYISEQSDFSKCLDCNGDCVLACDERIIYRIKDGSPIISFGEKGCTFCGKCAELCKFDVLSKVNPERIQVGIRINTSRCLAWNGVMCFTCKEPCLDNAIKFEGMFNPQILPDLCTGCGFCINICPSGAIEVFPKQDKSGYENES